MGCWGYKFGGDVVSIAMEVESVMANDVTNRENIQEGEDQAQNLWECLGTEEPGRR